jgi:serine/threonine-protein kinase
MGEVYRAKHRLLKRPCAIKLIRPECAGDTEMLRRFEREVQAATQLNHPNVLQVYDYGHTDDGTFFYAMEYLSGLNLDDLIERHGPLPAARAVHLLRQVCGALKEAHALGLIHRDVKPGNVMVCRFGQRLDVVKLLDFGLVQVTGPSDEDARLTKVGRILGTPAYMSPEQVTGETSLDARTDLYSLGATAYYLLTGQPPFVRPSVVATLCAHATEAVVPLRHLQPRVPLDVEAVVMRCLAKEPDGRYPHAGGLEEALAQCHSISPWSDAEAALWWGQQGAESLL